MAQKSDVTRSSVTTTTTTTVTSEVVQPAPTPPQRFTLVLKMGWQQMKEFYKGFRNNDLLEALKSEWKAITKKLQSGKDINAREIEIINRSTKEKLQERFSEFQSALCDSLELKESDDQRVKLVKIQLAKDIMQWLENLETWLMERLSAIFDENKVPDNKILEETEKFIDELNRAMKPPAVEEVIKNMESTRPSTSATKM